MSKWLAIVVLLLLGGCGAPLTVPQARATAEAGGCWPYGAVQPLPTATALPTATPRLNAPGAGVPTPLPVTPDPVPVVYPVCTPAPLTPTLTPTATATAIPWIPPTPQPASAVSALRDLHEATGVVRDGGIAWAHNPHTDGAVVAWIAYGWRTDAGTDGQVWVTSQAERGVWHQPQTVNLAPVVRNYGGLAVAAAPDGTLRLLFGDGDVDSVAQVYEVVSTDDGATWSDPLPIQQGRIQALRMDAEGNAHALLIGPEPFDAQLLYGYAPAGGLWQWYSVMGASHEYRADLALLEQDGELVRLIVTTRKGSPARPAPHLHLYRSTDGMVWERTVPTGAAPLVISDPTIRPGILAVPRGDGLVAVTWSNFGVGAVVASVSLDGGRSFGPAEIIAQHTPDGAFSDEQDYGIEPSVVYDPEADMLAASWNEIETGSGLFPYPVRSYLALRALDAPLGAPWLHSVTPDTGDRPRPTLDPQRRTFLMATPDGQRAGLIVIDERNYQARVLYRTIHLPSLTTQGES